MKKPRKQARAGTLTLRGLIKAIGLEATAKRLHRAPGTVRGWKGKPPKSALPEVTKVLRRSAAARTGARKKARELPRGKKAKEDRRELRRVQRQLAQALERERLGRLSLDERIREEEDRFVLGASYRTLKKIAQMYGVPIRQVYHAHLYPSLTGRKAA